jgi:predicted nucleic acid-binding protein
VRVYFDPSALIPLYLEEASSLKIRRFVLRHSPTILLNELQELELKNGIRQKFMRKEISEGVVAMTLRLLDDDLTAGIVVRKPVLWSTVYARAEQLSSRVSTRGVCRAFDLLHIAVASISGVKSFATLDHDQSAIAHHAKLKLVDFDSGIDA